MHQPTYRRSMRQSDGRGEVRVFVTVEDAPDLIVRPTTTLSRIARFDSLCLDCLLYELQGTALIAIDGHEHSITVSAVPVDKVRPFGAKALSEHKEIAPNGRSRRTPSRWSAHGAAGQLRSPEEMSSAVSSNSWRDRIGVAP
jgi:hypothetical protein